MNSLPPIIALFLGALYTLPWALTIEQCPRFDLVSFVHGVIFGLLIVIIIMAVCYLRGNRS
jgi:hypothetical protein